MEITVPARAASTGRWSWAGWHGMPWPWLHQISYGTKGSIWRVSYFLHSFMRLVWAPQINHIYKISNFNGTFDDQHQDFGAHYFETKPHQGVHFDLFGPSLIFWKRQSFVLNTVDDWVWLVQLAWIVYLCICCIYVYECTCCIYVYHACVASTYLANICMLHPKKISKMLHPGTTESEQSLVYSTACRWETSKSYGLKWLAGNQQSLGPCSTRNMWFKHLVYPFQAFTTDFSNSPSWIQINYPHC